MCCLILNLFLFTAPSWTEDPPPPGANLFPLAIGNVWTYKVSGQDDRFTIRAVRRDMVGAQPCVRLEATLKDRVVATEHVAFTRNGLYRFREDKEDVEPPVCVLRTLGSPRGWRTSRRAEFHVGSRNASASFSSKADDINVLGTKYKTTVVHAEVVEGLNRSTSSDTWYADGVGMVRQEIREGKRPSLVLELEKFAKGVAK